jgi:hypothetical protein
VGPNRLLVASPNGPGERRGRTECVEVRDGATKQREIDTCGNLGRDPCGPGQPLCHAHERHGVVRDERRAGMIGGFGRGGNSHGYHAKRIGEPLRGYQSSVIALDPDICSLQPLRGRGSFSYRLQWMERSAPGTGLFQRQQGVTVEQT